MSTSPVFSFTAEQLHRMIAEVIGQATPVAVTWSELWNAYAAAELEKLEAPATQRSMGGCLVRLLGPTQVASSTSETLRSYRARRRMETIRSGCRGAGGHPSAKTINNEIILALRLTKWAARQRPPLIEVDPFASIDRRDVLVPVDNVRLNVVDDRPDAPLSLAGLLADADPLDRALVLVAHSSGIRRRELARLELAWIDRRERLIAIPTGVSKGQRDRKRGRTTVISQEAIAAIDAYRATLPAAAQGAPWVFVNTRRRAPAALHPDFFTRRFRTLQEAAGATGPSGATWLHDLRRSFITLARRRGEDAVSVMKLAGHTTIESQERYHVESLEETMLIRDRIELARSTAVRSATERPSSEPIPPQRVRRVRQRKGVA